ncbi:hypothetical protein [Capybara microvirus Cap1_SP_161]|nr:hypothetical protein [Capybara microvirus Cap1_SP_161]
MNLYVLYDKEAHIVQCPYPQPLENDTIARRWWKKSTESLVDVMGILPSMISLYCVGIWNKETGEITPCFDEVAVISSDD